MGLAASGREAFYPCYGLAEATLLVAGGHKTAPPIVRWFDARSLEADRAVPTAANDDGARPLVGCGQTMPDQQTVIADPSRLTRMPAGQVGEVWVAGPSVAQGYWRRTDESEQTFRARLHDTGEGPFLRTGDLGFTHDGELFVTGRLKDMLIIHGRNHYPQDLEATVARSHASLRAGWAAAFTVGEGPEQQVVIIVELERHQRAAAAQVVGDIRRDVAREHDLVVDSIVLVRAGTIPRTSSGKIQRHACRDAFLGLRLDVVADWHRAASDRPVVAPASSQGRVPRSEERGRDAAAEPRRPEAARGPAPLNGGRVALRAQTLEATGEIVLDVVRAIGKDRTVGIGLDSSIVEMGLDSLERMEIVAALESHFGGRLPDQVVAEMYTCREVIDAVQKYLVDARDSRGTSGAVAIPAEDHRFDLYPEYIKLKESFEMLEATGLTNPFFRVHERVANDTTVIGGRELINFSSYNYVGMSGDPVVSAAARAAIDRYGTSVSASRLVSGETGLHRELERGIADFIGVDDAIVFVGGHSTNETTVGHLFGPGDLILHDALAHNSIVQGAMLSRAQRRPFPHNDWVVVDRVLADLRGDLSPRAGRDRGRLQHGRRHPGPAPVHRGQQAPQGLPLVDEAHSAGVLGPHGRGIGEHFGVNPARRGSLDGHAQQVLRELRRVHRGRPGDGGVSQVHRAGLRVQRRHLAGQRGRRPRRDPALDRRARAGRRASRAGAPVPRPGPGAGLEHRPEPRLSDRARDPGGLAPLPAAVAGNVRPRDQRAADSLSRRSRSGRRGCASSSPPATPRSRSATRST